MKCKATVHTKAVSIRARNSPTVDRCQRNVRTEDGYCYQHDPYTAACSHLGCARRATVREGGRLLCRAHAPLWRAHNRIVQRILRIPPR